MMDHPSWSAVWPRRLVLYSLLLLLGLAADLWTKQVMFARPTLEAGRVEWVVPGFAGYQRSLNQGALFGIGQGNAWIFAAVAAVAMVALLVWLFAFRAATDLRLTAILGVISGGVLGNLYDRLGLHGLVWDRDWPLELSHMPAQAGEPIHAVRDWILLQWSDVHRWPNFNVADTLLVTGAITLLALSYFDQGESTHR